MNTDNVLQLNQTLQDLFSKKKRIIEIISEIIALTNHKQNKRLKNNHNTLRHIEKHRYMALCELLELIPQYKEQFYPLIQSFDLTNWNYLLSVITSNDFIANVSNFTKLIQEAKYTGYNELEIKINELDNKVSLVNQITAEKVNDTTTNT